MGLSLGRCRAAAAAPDAEATVEAGAAQAVAGFGHRGPRLFWFVHRVKGPRSHPLSPPLGVPGCTAAQVQRGRARSTQACRYARAQ